VDVFTSVSGIAAPLLEDDINTDQIAPVSGQLNPDYGYWLFARHRRTDDGAEIADFVLNRPQFRQPSILVTGRNFGCGSSREAAVWGLIAFGIRCLVGWSFSEIFRENCLQNGVLCVELPPDQMQPFQDEVLVVDGAAPFVVDLPEQVVGCPSGRRVPFEISAADKMRLMEGLDEIGLTLKHVAEIEAWEATTAVAAPWLQTIRDKRLG
jgi:3-isopropylmalate dehydratase small subunit